LDEEIETKLIVVEFAIVIGMNECTNKGYPSTSANLTLIILFSELLKISKIISSKSKNIVNDNSEYLRIFHMLK
jgi:hypothetical protein